MACEESSCGCGCGDEVIICGHCGLPLPSEYATCDECGEPVCEHCEGENCPE